MLDDDLEPSLLGSSAPLVLHRTANNQEDEESKKKKAHERAQAEDLGSQ